MRYISSDYIFPISSEPIKEGVVVIDNGVIIDILKKENLQSVDIEYFHGIILPGFINTHCHLELSHMKGLTKTGTGLIPFISDVLKLREFDLDTIKAGIKQQDQLMFSAGIQAVGDISNKKDTAEIKNKSEISYYTFVEMFDFMQPNIFDTFLENYRAVYRDQSNENGNKKSWVPHAPYSVSKKLCDFINRANPEDATISIHNQETKDENLLFQKGEGGFIDFYKTLGIEMDNFKPTGKTAIDYAIKLVQPKARNIFVHNTMSTLADIQLAHQWSENVFWATCPNANLFIENRLPNYRIFMDQEAKMTIGTDSIMSNWQLSIWEEIKTIKRYQSYVSIYNLFKWGTLNGAKALGFEKKLGSIEKGKSPGLIQIELDWEGEETDLRDSAPYRII